MTVHTIITENLAMRKICAKLVPKVLTDDQKQRRVSACEDLLQRVEKDTSFLDNVITGDESWFYWIRPGNKGSKFRMLHCSITSSKKGSHEQIQNESHAHRFLRCQGGGPLRIRTWGATREWCFLPKRAKKTEEKGQLGEASPRRKLEIASRQCTQPHLIQGDRPPYGPDLAPADCFLFPKVESSLKGRSSWRISHFNICVSNAGFKNLTSVGLTMWMWQGITSGKCSKLNL